MNETLHKTKIVYGFFSQYVFPEVKMNLPLVRNFFAKDALTSNNKLIHSLLSLVERNEFTNITEGSFRVVLAESGKSDAEADSIIEDIKKYKMYTADQAKELKDHVKSMCHSALLEDAKYRYKDDPIGFVNYLKKQEYQSNFSDTLTIKNFGSIQIEDIYAAYSQGSFLSKYAFINNSFPIKKVPNGQLVMVVGAPGAGKSFYMMEETDNLLSQGKRVHYIAMGDLTEMDFIIRLIAIRTGLSLDDVTINIIKYYAQYKHLFTNLDITIVPSGKVTAHQYFELMKRNANDYDAFFVDYDSNFARNDEQMMYLAHGDAYDLLTELSRMGKMVFVASQPKQFFWDHDRLPLESAGESSRKQQICDMIITIGKSDKSGTRCGWISLVKNRRGTFGMAAPYIAKSNGAYGIVTEAVYAKYRSDRTPRKFTQKELDLLIATEVMED